MSFEKGDKVYSLRFNKWGVIIGAHQAPGDSYPIEVRFDDSLVEWYATNGKYEELDHLVDLYHGVPQIIVPPEPNRLPDFKVDQPLHVQDPDGQWHKRHFKCWSPTGSAICFNGGRTSFTTNRVTSVWSVWEKHGECK